MPPTIQAFFDTFTPFGALLVGGIVGGLSALFLESIRNRFTWSLFLYLPIGLVAAIISNLITSVQGNSGIFLSAWVVGIAGVTLFEQFYGGKEIKRSLSTAILEQGNQKLENESAKIIID